MTSNAQTAVEAASRLAAADINTGSVATVRQILYTAGEIADWLDARDAGERR